MNADALSRVNTAKVDVSPQEIFSNQKTEENLKAAEKIEKYGEGDLYYVDDKQRRLQIVLKENQVKKKWRPVMTPRSAERPYNKCYKGKILLE